VVEQGVVPHVSGPVELPSPSWPALFGPQQSTAPPESIAQLAPAMEMALTPVRLGTATGSVEHEPPELQVSGPVDVPMPSSPSVLSPQHSTVPTDRSAQALKIPADMAVTPLNPDTATGVVEQASIPVPKRHVSGPVETPVPSSPSW